MAITPLNADMNIIARLSDEPNDVDGLSASELKARFDEAGNTIKGYINGTLVTEVDAELASVERVILDEVDRKIVASGNVPAGGNKGQALVKASGADNDTVWAAIPAVPVGGDEGQVLSKRSGADGDVSFETQTALNVAISEAAAEQLGFLPVTGRNVEEGLLATSPKVGDILTTARTDLNSDWLLCNGDWYDTEQYPELKSMCPADPFKVITINVPMDAGVVGYSEVSGAWLYLTTDGRRAYHTTDRSLKTWNLAPYQFPEAVCSIDYANGYWCAAARNSANVYYSASITASSWTVQSIGITPTRMKFLNNTWIATSYGTGTVAYKEGTPNGVWSTLNSQLASVYDLDYGNGYFVFSGNYSSASYISYTTSLSVTPTRQALNSSGIARAVIYAGTTWYCIAANESSPTYYCRALTPNGTWTGVLGTTQQYTPTGFLIVTKNGVDYCVDVPAPNYLSSEIRYKKVSELSYNSVYQSFMAPSTVTAPEGRGGKIAVSDDCLIICGHNNNVMASPIQLPTLALGLNSYIKGR